MPIALFSPLWYDEILRFLFIVLVKHKNGSEVVDLVVAKGQIFFKIESSKHDFFIFEGLDLLQLIIDIASDFFLFHRLVFREEVSSDSNAVVIMHDNAIS